MLDARSSSSIENRETRIEMDKIRTAVVGVGKMGTIHAKVYDQLPQSDFVAVVDIDGDKAERLANQYGCQAFTNCMDVWNWLKYL
jgi:predicted dehydrogenase